MRGLTGRDQAERFMRALGNAVTNNTRVYLTGGASAVLLEWRDSTIDINLTFVPEGDEVFRAIARLKDELGINVELASPAHFIPSLPDWDTRSTFIAQEGRVAFYHYDFYSQAMAKIERGHAQDRVDVAAMLARGLVEPGVVSSFGQRSRDIKIVPARESGPCPFTLDDYYLSVDFEGHRSKAIAEMKMANAKPDVSRSRTFSD